MLPQVSVVIPLFNAGPYVSETITSALNQTGVKVEVIVVDDESTDDGPEVVESLIRDKGSHVRLIRSSKIGQARARNLGVVHAKYDYVAFLDADDVWMASKSQLQLELLMSDEDGVSVVTGYEIFQHGSGRTLGVVSRQWDETSVRRWLLLE